MRSKGVALLQRSLKLARNQEEESWELRTAASIARHWRARQRSGEATAVVDPVFARFTEGFATADWLAARALVEAL